MSVSPEMMVVAARILPAPPITYGSGSMQPKDASWNLMKKRFREAAPMANWSYLIIEDNFPIPVDAVVNIMKTFEKTCKEYGMAANPPTLKFADGSYPLKVRLPRERGPIDLEIAMKPAFKKLQENNIQITYVFLPGQEKGVYAAVKYCGDVKAGVGTVCSQWNKVNKDRGQDQYLANVALKFNMKMGGTNHTLAPAQLGDLKGGKTMIVSFPVGEHIPIAHMLTMIC